MPHRQGRVFTRLKQYEALPADQKSEIEALEQHLTSIKTQIFEKHHPKLIKSAVGVKYKDLLEKIDDHLVHNGGRLSANDTSSKTSKTPATRGTHGTHSATAGAAADADVSSASKSHGVTGGVIGGEPMLKNQHGDLTHQAAHTSHAGDKAHDTGSFSPLDDYQERTTRGFGAAGATHEPTTKDKMALGEAEAKDKSTPGPTLAHTSGQLPHTFGDGHLDGPQRISSSSGSRDDAVDSKDEMKAKVQGHAGDLRTSGTAKRLVEGLILKGFITPYDEDDKLPSMNTRETFEFKDSDLFVPVAKQVSGLTGPTTSVWDVAHGAIYANMLRRKANLIEKIKYGKDVYAVVDTRTETLTLFDDDASHKAIVQFKARGTLMEEDLTAFEHGVKIWNETDSELFDPSTRPERDVFVGALRQIGVKGMDGAGVVAYGGSAAGMAKKGVHNATDKLKHHDRHDDVKGHPAGRTEKLTGHDHHDEGKGHHHGVTDKLKDDHHHTTNTKTTHGVGAAAGIGAVKHDPHKRDHEATTTSQGYSIGAAHGEPTTRMSEEPTMKDKAAHAVAKVTPGHSTTHDKNMSGQSADGTHRHKHDPVFGQHKGQGELHGGTNLMKNDHRTHTMMGDRNKHGILSSGNDQQTTHGDQLTDGHSLDEATKGVRHSSGIHDTRGDVVQDVANMHSTDRHYTDTERTHGGAVQGVSSTLEGDHHSTAGDHQSIGHDSSNVTTDDRYSVTNKQPIGQGSSSLTASDRNPSGSQQNQRSVIEGLSDNLKGDYHLTTNSQTHGQAGSSLVAGDRQSADDQQTQGGVMDKLSNMIKSDNDYTDKQQASPVQHVTYSTNQPFASQEPTLLGKASNALYSVKDYMLGASPPEVMTDDQPVQKDQTTTSSGSQRFLGARDPQIAP